MVIIIMEEVTTEDIQITTVAIRIIMADTQIIIMEGIQIITMEGTRTIITEVIQTITMEDTQIIIMADTNTVITEDGQIIIMADTKTIIMEGIQTTTMEDIQATMETVGLFSHKFLVLDHQEVIKIRTLQLPLERNKSPFLKHVIHFYLC